MSKSKTPAEVAAETDAALVSDLLVLDKALALHGLSIAGIIIKAAKDQHGVAVELPAPVVETVEAE